MGVLKSRARDIGDWIEPIPEGAPESWCLPAYGGRVVVRGYDTYRSDLWPLRGSARWMVDGTFVPLTQANAKRIGGRPGLVFPGDCVIFFGVDVDHSEGHLWYPQRVVHVEASRAGWQQVWAVRDTSDMPESLTDAQAGGLPSWMQTEEPLHGRQRRMALERFGLNVDCPE